MTNTVKLDTLVFLGRTVTDIVFRCESESRLHVRPGVPSEAGREKNVIQSTTTDKGEKGVTKPRGQIRAIYQGNQDMSTRIME